jgi:hypothetical protein
VFQSTQSLARGEYLPTAPWRNIEIPLYEGGHTPLYEGILACTLEYPKLNTWTEANLGKFLIPLVYKVLFLLYEGLSVGFLIPSLRRSLPSLRRSSYGIKKNLLWSKIFQWYNTMLPIYWAPSIYWITFILIKIYGHHPSSFLTASNHDPPFRIRRHSSL